MTQPGPMPSNALMKHLSPDILMGALVYLLSPIDGIPDFLPGGFVDDMSVLIAALYSTGFIGKEHLRACRLKRGLTQKEENNESTQETP